MQNPFHREVCDHYMWVLRHFPAVFEETMGPVTVREEKNSVEISRRSFVKRLAEILCDIDASICDPTLEVYYQEILRMMSSKVIVVTPVAEITSAKQISAEDPEFNVDNFVAKPVDETILPEIAWRLGQAESASLGETYIMNRAHFMHRCMTALHVMDNNFSVRSEETYMMQMLIFFPPTKLRIGELYMRTL